MTDTPSSSVEHLSVVMTTEIANDVTQTTNGNVAMTSSPSRGIEFYFQCVVIVIGIVGTTANALILYGFIVSKQHKKNVLIFHQNVLDFLCCLFLVIIYSLKLCNIYLSGSGGYWFCMLLVSENFIWCLILASKANLMIVTVERYLKAVYPIWSKKNLRKLVLYSAMAFAWISGFAHNIALTFGTSGVVDGVCYGYVFWKSRVDQKAYGIWYFLSFYVIVLLLFIYCYWRILVAIRRQARVMAAHSAAGQSTAGALSSSTVGGHHFKTMIIDNIVRQISISRGSVTTQRLAEQTEDTVKEINISQGSVATQ